jgi:hypothetical protein
VSLAEVERWVTETRTRQGLPPQIEDEATLHQLAAMVLEIEGGGGDARAA